MKKYTLVTGASGGIGSAVALKLAEMGHNLYLHYNQNGDAIRSLMNRLECYKGEYIPVQADLSTSGGYRVLTPQIFRLTDVVHCGGTGRYGILQDLGDEEAEELFRVHVLNPIFLTRDLLPKMLPERKGNIVFVSSIWGQTGAACEAAYSAAKGAQMSFAKALSKELAPSGIRVNAVAPGAVNTAMLSVFTPEEQEHIAEDIPMGRLAAPLEIANAVSFLLSEDSSYITGQVLAVNGGWYT